VTPTECESSFRRIEICAFGMMRKMPTAPENTPLTLQQYRSLANFRYELRRFLRYSEQVTRRYGLTPLQYQLLLQIKGYPKRDRVTIGELAERLQAKHHGIVSLATRCENLGLVKRQASKDDRRVVYLTLSPKGSRVLEHLARWHRDELRTLQGRFIVPPMEPSQEP
jgi:DNA-binding MarR family transcriptional regulator